MITPELQAAVNKVLRDSLERLLDDSVHIRLKEKELKLLYDFAARKRLDLLNARRPSKYDRYYNGWKYVKTEEPVVRKQRVRK